MGTFPRPEEAGRGLPGPCLIREGRKGVGRPLWNWEHVLGAAGAVTRSRICHIVATTTNHPHTPLSRI